MYVNEEQSPILTQVDNCQKYPILQASQNLDEFGTL